MSVHAVRAVVAALLIPGICAAQSHARPDAPGRAGSEAVAASAVRPLLGPAMVARIHPIKWLYALSVETGGTPERIGFRTLEIKGTTYHEKPSWLVIDSRRMHTLVLAESLWVAKADLEPLHRVLHTATGQAVSVFAHDSIRTTFDDDSAGHKVVMMANERGVIPTLYLLEVLLGMSPLSADWSANARLAAIDRESSGIVSVTTRTVGAEQVLIPDGQFDAWLVELHVGKGLEKIWVRKSDGVVVKEEVPVLGMPGARLEQILALDGVKPDD